MEKAVFNQALIWSLKKLFKKDALLVNQAYNVNERSVSHKLAVYIDQYLFDNNLSFDVDIEYNRMTVPYDENGIDIGIAVAKSIRYDDHEQLDRFVYPDIIIHRRNENVNIGIIEIKMAWKNSLKQLDYQKVNKYLEQLDYQHGVFIEINNTFESTIIEYGHFDIN
ncbi:PD-(D/E)XK nuclease superfamily protein [Dokdonia sp. Hel_I_63]|uniref:hypothetical protein n=1 Tax=Dokdonia sp. Hel_I_63 TaxID=1249996 RepID=UPI00119BE625|nr:hypothetical protein [Dokdonia sp. Hel_I_63]TVZ23459.1 PD-(D/E)XK nuclease superfamily protein [Dokdonia sp. Hel_I_63]